MKYLIISFLISFLTCLIIIKLNRFHDVEEGVQKFHKKPTPRIGGLSIYLSLIITTFFLYNKAFIYEYFLFIVCVLPVFISGLLEDITKNIAPKFRLISGFIAGALAFFLLSAGIKRTEITLFDYFINYELISFLITIFCLGGIVHAFNIIDGFNGLSSGVAMMIFGAYSYISFLQNDFFILYLSLILLSATFGFFLWNYPFGYIFLGDGGAYLLGFSSGLLGILLINRNPEVSAWVPVLLLIYPVWETLFSIYRRKFLRNASPYLPDALHFHQIIYRRLIKFVIGRNVDPLRRNYYTSPFLWIIELFCVIIAVSFWNKTYVLMLATICFIVFYTWFYFRVIKFKTPKILHIRR